MPLPAEESGVGEPSRRVGPAATVGDEAGDADLRVPVPAGVPEALAPLVHVVRAQQLALHATLALGLDPAKPLLIGTQLRLPASTQTVEPASAVVADVATVRASLDHWAAHYGVDPHLARALAWMESGFNNSMVSPAGARGIMQLLPSTWDYVTTVLIGHAVPSTADGNVQVGVAYLRHLLAAFQGNERLALAAWYQGERAVRQQGVLNVSEVFVADVLALKQRM